MSHNAIMTWANQGRVDTESWGRYLERTYARPREMTAADLGLPSHHEVWTSQPMMDFAKAQHELRQADAPYSFWLGAGAHG